MADQKITQLNANTAPVYTDVFSMVDDPDGSAETQKITYTNLFKGVPLLSFGDAPEFTIRTGEIDLGDISPSNLVYSTIDTEEDAASDDLDTIESGNDGQILIIRPNNDARTVVVKNGTGNIVCAGDFTMDSVYDNILLIFDSGLNVWIEISRTSNG